MPQIADPTAAPPTLDPVAAARWAGHTPRVSAWLHEEVARRMVQRLGWIKAQPAAWCHWEALRGGLQGHAQVASHYPKSVCYVHESTPDAALQARQHFEARWWQARRWSGPTVRVQAPGPSGVQMLWSNMALHAAAQPAHLLQQWHEALDVGGFLMFSCLGPDTLRELRALYAALHWGPCGHEFTDMHDWGDMLLQSGFAEPVMDMERVVLTYDRPEAILEELRGLGRNWHPGRFAALRGRGWRQELLAAMDQRLRVPAHGNRLALTFEIVYGHALKAAARIPVQAESQVSLQQMRAVLRRSGGTT